MVFKEFGQRKKPSVCLLSWRELDEEIHVALRMRLAPEDRPKQREAGHPQSADLLLALGQPLNGLLAVKNRRLHAHRVAAICLEANKMTERPNQP